MQRLLSSKEIKSVLKVSDCELMHMRACEYLAYERRGRNFFYALPPSSSILDHPLGQQLIHWHISKHQLHIDNYPEDSLTISALEKLVWDILLPIERKFSRPVITYGFTSSALHRVIRKYFSEGTAPNLDQHAACEKNSKGNHICQRNGAACDFFVANANSIELVKYITNELDYDRIYFYGADRPVHVSITLDEPTRHLQVMGVSEKGRRYPAQRALGNAAQELAASL